MAGRINDRLFDIAECNQLSINTQGSDTIKSTISKHEKFTVINDIFRTNSTSYVSNLDANVIDNIETMNQHSIFVDSDSKLKLWVPGINTALKLQEILEVQDSDSLGSGGQARSIQYKEGPTFTGAPDVRVAADLIGIETYHITNSDTGYREDSEDLKIKTRKSTRADDVDYNHLIFNHEGRRTTFGYKALLDMNESLIKNASGIRFDSSLSDNSNDLWANDWSVSRIEATSNSPFIYSSVQKQAGPSADVYPFNATGHLIVEMHQSRNFVVATTRNESGENKVIPTLTVREDGINLSNYSDNIDTREIESYNSVSLRFNNRANITYNYDSDLLGVSSNTIDMKVHIQSQDFIASNLQVTRYKPDGRSEFNDTNTYTKIHTDTLRISSTNSVSFDGNVQMLSKHNLPALSVNLDGNVGIGNLQVDTIENELHVSANALFDKKVTLTGIVDVKGDATFSNLIVTGSTIHTNVVTINDLILEDRMFLLANTNPLVAKSDANLQGSGLKILTTDGNVSITYEHNGSLYFDGTQTITGPAWQFSDNIALPAHAKIHTNMIQSSNIEEPLQFLSHDGKGLIVIQKEGHVGYGNLGINKKVPDKLLYAREVSDGVTGEATARFAHHNAQGKAGVELMIGDTDVPGGSASSGGKIMYDGSDQLLKLGHVIDNTFTSGISVDNYGFLQLSKVSTATSTTQSSGKLRYNETEQYVEVSKNNKWFPVGPDVNLFSVSDGTFDENYGAVKIVRQSEPQSTLTIVQGANSEELKEEENKIINVSGSYTYNFTQTDSLKFRVKQIRNTANNPDSTHDPTSPSPWYESSTGVWNKWHESPPSITPIVGDTLIVYNDARADQTANLYVSEADGSITQIRSKDLHAFANGIDNVYGTHSINAVTTSISDVVRNTIQPQTVKQRVVFASPGTTTWTVPKTVTSLNIAAIGGGGRGSVSQYGGGGGGSGYVFIGNRTVSQQNELVVTVGKGADSISSASNTIVKCDQWDSLSNIDVDHGKNATGNIGGDGGAKGGYTIDKLTHDSGNVIVAEVELSVKSSMDIIYGYAGRIGHISSPSDSDSSNLEGGSGGAGGILLSTQPTPPSVNKSGSGETGYGYGAGGGGSKNTLQSGNDGIVVIEYEQNLVYQTDYVVYEPKDEGHYVFTTPFGTKDINMIMIGGGAYGGGTGGAADGNIITQHFEENSTYWRGGKSYNITVGKGGKYYSKDGSDSNITGEFLSGGISTKHASGGRQNHNSGYNLKLDNPSLTVSDINTFSNVENPNDYPAYNWLTEYGRDSSGGVLFNGNGPKYNSHRRRFNFYGKSPSGYGASGEGSGKIHRSIYQNGIQSLTLPTFTMSELTNDGFDMVVIGITGDTNGMNIIGNGNFNGNEFSSFPPEAQSTDTFEDTIITHSLLIDEPSHVVISDFSINASNIQSIRVLYKDTQGEFKANIYSPPTKPRSTVNIFGVVINNGSSLNNIDDWTTQDITNDINNSFKDHNNMNTSNVTDVSGHITLDGKNATQYDSNILYIEWDELLDNQTTSDEVISTFLDGDGAHGLVYIEYTHLVPFHTDSGVMKSSTVVNYGDGVDQIAVSKERQTVGYIANDTNTFNIVQVLPSTDSYYNITAGGVPQPHDKRYETMDGNNGVRTVELSSPGEELVLYNNGPLAIDSSTNLEIIGGDEEVFTGVGAASLDVTFASVGAETIIYGDPPFSKYVTSSGTLNIKPSSAFATDTQTNYDVYINNIKRGRFTEEINIHVDQHSVYTVIVIGKPLNQRAVANIELDIDNQLKLINETVKFDCDSVLINSEKQHSYAWPQRIYLNKTNAGIDSYIEGIYTGKAKTKFEFIIKYTSGDTKWTYQYKEDEVDTTPVEFTKSNDMKVDLIYGMRLCGTIPDASTDIEYDAVYDKLGSKIVSNDTALTLHNKPNDRIMRYMHINEVHEAISGNNILIPKSGLSIELDIDRFSSTKPIAFKIAYTSADNTLKVYYTEEDTFPVNLPSPDSEKIYYDGWHNIGKSVKCKFIDSPTTDTTYDFTLYPFISYDNNSSLSILDKDSTQIVSVDNESFKMHVSPSDVWEYYHDVKQSPIIHGYVSVAANNLTTVTIGHSEPGFAKWKHVALVGGTITINGVTKTIQGVPSGTTLTVQEPGFPSAIPDTGTYAINPPLKPGIEARGYFTGITELDEVKFEIYPVTSGSCRFVGPNKVEKQIYATHNEWIYLENGIEILFTDTLDKYTGAFELKYDLTIKKKPNVLKKPLQILQNNHATILDVDQNGMMCLSGLAPAYKISHGNTTKINMHKTLIAHQAPELANFVVTIKHATDTSIPCSLKLSGVMYGPSGAGAMHFVDTYTYMNDNNDQSITGTLNPARQSLSPYEFMAGHSEYGANGKSFTSSYTLPNGHSAIIDLEYYGPDNVGITIE